MQRLSPRAIRAESRLPASLETAWRHHDLRLAFAFGERLAPVGVASFSALGSRFEFWLQFDPGSRAGRQLWVRCLNEQGDRAAVRAEREAPRRLDQGFLDVSAVHNLC